MRKILFLLVIGIICTFLTACNTSTQTENIAKKEQEAHDKTAMNYNEPEVTNKEESWSLIENKLDIEWSKVLREQGNIQFELDGQKGYIDIQYSKPEGGTFISHLEVGFDGIKEPLVITDYDASFEKLGTLDTDNDGKKELFLLFDTHGAGGQGTYELMLIKRDETAVIATKISEHIDKNMFNVKVEFTKDKMINLLKEDGSIKNKLKIVNNYYDFLYDERELYQSTEGKADGIYDFAIVRWNEEDRLMIYQYVWGYDHSDGIADILSIVNLNNKPYQLEKQWVLCNYSDAVEVY